MIAEHYMGQRVDTEPIVWVCRRGVNKRLDPARSLAVCKHSPNGFEWGYGGSGPAQLALAILLDHGLPHDQAERLHQDFKFDLVARMTQRSWFLSGDAIQSWIDSKLQTTGGSNAV